ncbi:MAG: 1-deoxy-D-xylulose-5-phosphate reductoisomerase [Acidothermus cellulolyticus]|nr:1-deoxy-D-xylulose-5-phosphate reductoisomerase [Acidothermus cellulolyticus]
MSSSPLAPQPSSPMRAGRLPVRPLVILGSTGSIGTQALDVVRNHPDLFRVVGLAASGSRLDLLARQAVEFGVEVIGVTGATSAEVEHALAAAAAERGRAAPHPKIVSGPEAAAEVAAWPLPAAEPRDGVVLNGITGSIGLAPTVAALRAGRTLALANKESLIAGGPLVKAIAEPGQIVPVDSEHSALAQCLRAGRADEVRRLILTASGGPFRGRRRADLVGVTAEQALAHPTWRMGPVITINSATLVNKALEVIEAHLLFDISLDAIDVVIHPQSVVHSMVEFIDGSTVAHCSPPNMRLPIALALAWPYRLPAVIPSCDWRQATAWTFEPVDGETFPAIDIARQVGAAGGVAPAAFNAANEEAVAAFLAGRLDFLGIMDVVAAVTEKFLAAPPVPVRSVSDVLDAEREARRLAGELIGGRR